MTPVNATNSPQLRIVAAPPVANAPADPVDAVDAFCRGFRQATGWPLRHDPDAETTRQTESLWTAPVDPGVGIAPGSLAIGSLPSSSDEDVTAVALEVARQIAAAAVPLVSEFLRTHRALVRREAELAMAVPVVARPSDTVHVAERLQAVLRGAALGLGCDAAALYLMDAAATELKLRSAWGLPRVRWTEPARSLPESFADLEAMTGHAVVLENEPMLAFWRAPFDGQSAVCVPVASASCIHGTFWMSCDDERSFSDAETGLMEVIAGRLAVELEHESLLQDAGAEARSALHATDAAQRSRVWQVPPDVEGWHVAGISQPGRQRAGCFHDWFMLSGDDLGLAVGHAQHTADAKTAHIVRTAIHAHAEHVADPGDVLRRANATLWHGSAGDQFATACFARLNTHANFVRLAAAGDMSIIRLAPGRQDTLSAPQIPLGVQLESAFTSQRINVRPGETLIISADDRSAASDAAMQHRPLWKRIAGALRDAPVSATALMRNLEQAARVHLETVGGGSILIVRRTS